MVAGDELLKLGKEILKYFCMNLVIPLDQENDNPTSYSSFLSRLPLWMNKVDTELDDLTIVVTNNDGPRVNNAVINDTITKIESKIETIISKLSDLQSRYNKV